MKTIWFCGNNEKTLTTVGEVVGEGLITRNQFAEIIVHSEVSAMLGRGLKDTKEDKSVFADRIGFLGYLLHRNNIFALIISNKTSLDDRKAVKESYKNYVQVNLGEKDELTDIELDPKENENSNAKKIVKYLTSQKLIPEHAQEVYSKEEEEEIRRRLEELGYV